MSRVTSSRIVGVKISASRCARACGVASFLELRARWKHVSVTKSGTSMRDNCEQKRCCVGKTHLQHGESTVPSSKPSTSHQHEHVNPKPKTSLYLSCKRFVSVAADVERSAFHSSSSHWLGLPPSLLAIMTLFPSTRVEKYRSTSDLSQHGPQARRPMYNPADTHLTNSVVTVCTCVCG